jgi:hypothetical protein
MKYLLIILISLFGLNLIAQTYPDTTKLNVVEGSKFMYRTVQEFIDSSDIAQNANVASYTEIIFTVDSIEQILTNTHVVDQLVRDKQNGATYKIQTDSIAGYVTDSIGVIPTSVGYAVLQPDQDGFYNAFHFGVDTSATDNSPPFQAAYDFAKLFDAPVKVDRPGVYKFAGYVDDADVTNDVYIKAIGDVTFQVDGAQWGRFLNRVEPEFTVDSLPFDNSKGNIQFKLLNADLLDVGDLIAIEQADTVGTIGTKRELIEVVSVLNDTTVLLLDSLLFTHADTNTYTSVRVFKKRSFTLEGIKFDFKFDYQTTGSFGINIWGFNGSTIRDVHFINDTYDSQLLDGIAMYGCANTFFDNTKYRNLRYGSLVNVSARLRIINSYVEDCRHLSAITTWTKDVYVSDAVGYRCRALIEAHFGWNLHYNNIRSEQHGRLTLRSFGELKITNSYIRTDNTEDQETIYTLLGYHFADDAVGGTEFQWLIDRTNILFDNVEYVETNGTGGVFSGLTATGFKTMRVNNCITTAVGAYENLITHNATIHVTNSRIGHMYARNGADYVTLENVIFDRDLNRVGYLISHSQSDTLIVRNALLLNTDSLPLEENWQANGGAGLQGVYEFHSVTGPIRNLAIQATTLALASAKPMKFYNCDIILSDTIVPLYNTQAIEDITQRSNSTLTFSDDVLYDSYRGHSGEDEYISLTTPNRKVKIDSLGVHFNRSAGGYFGGIHGTNPRTGVQDNDVHIFSNDRIEFHGSSGTVDLAHMNTVEFFTRVPSVLKGTGEETDISSFGDEPLVLRAGDGSATRSVDIGFRVKDDIEVMRVDDTGMTEWQAPNDVNQKVKIDSTGLILNQSPGGYNAGVTNKDPVSGLLDNDLHLYAVDAIEFHGTSGSVDLGFWNNLAFESNVRIATNNVTPADIHSVADQDFTIRAGDGNPARTSDIGFLVKDDLLVMQVTDSEEVLVGTGATDQGAYTLQVNGDEYVSGSTTYGVSGEGINFVDAGQSVTATTTGIDVDLPSGDALSVVTAETNDDPNWVVSQARVATTDATVTTLQTIPITASRTYYIESVIIARRTGGTAGTADDGAAYEVSTAYTTKAGTVTAITAPTVLERADVIAYNATFTISGTNVLVEVTGVLDTNITWHCTTKVSYVGT